MKLRMSPPALDNVPLRSRTKPFGRRTRDVDRARFCEVLEGRVLQPGYKTNISRRLLLHVPFLQVQLIGLSFKDLWSLDRVIGYGSHGHLESANFSFG